MRSDFPAFSAHETRANVASFRRGIDERRKVRFHYTDRTGAETERSARPLCPVFWGSAWTASAWCELRDGFRNFRPDRMRHLELLDEGFEDEPGKDLESLMRLMREAQEARAEQSDRLDHG